MSLSDLSSMTDLPFGGKKKSTHRGRRSRGHGPRKDHAQHHAALNAAMASGDHGKAKSAALMLANALHAKTRPTPAAPAMEPPAGDGMDGMGAPTNEGGLPFSKPMMG